MLRMRVDGCRWAALTVVVLSAMPVLAGCGSSQTSSSSTATSAPSPAAPAATAAAACRASQVAASYAGTNGATGHLELMIALRNVSRTPCRLRGYPHAMLLDRAGRRLPLHVRRGSGFFPDSRAAPAPVAMRPGGRARFGIGVITNNEYAGAHVCRVAATAVTAAPGIAVHWQRVSLRRAPRISPCGSRATVSPVHA